MDVTPVSGDDGSAPPSHITLARICVEIAQIRTLCAAAGDSVAQEAERVLAALREGTDVSGAERDLHRLLRRSGVAGGLRGITRGAGIGGMPPTPGHPVGPTTLVCPVGRCSRVVLPDDPPDVPRECQLHARQLRRLAPRS